jgi:hypothetical protein
MLSGGIMSQTPFKSNKIDQIRYVWDPAVHDRYNENCHFVLLKLGQPASRAKDLEQTINDLQLEGVAVYLILGDWDLLLRLWARPANVSGLLAKIGQALPISRHEVFVASEISYVDWSDQRFNVGMKHVAAHQEAVDVVCGPSSSGLQVATALKELEEAHLVHVLNPLKQFSNSDLPLIKVFVALQRSSSSSYAYGADMMSEIAAAVSARPYLRFVSLYYGQSRTLDCIIKGVIPAREYPGLGDWLNNLDAQLQSRHLELLPMTLMVAGDQHNEADVLSVDRAELGNTGRMIQALASPEFGASLERLGADHLRAIEGVFEKHFRELLETPLEADFMGVIESGFDPDFRRLARHCSFVTEMEADFRETTTRNLLPGALGRKTWRRRTQEALREELVRLQEAQTPTASESESQLESPSRRLKVTSNWLDAFSGSPDSLGFGECLGVLQLLTSRGLVDSTAASELFGPSWRGRYQEAVGLRNDLAHARLARLRVDRSSQPGYVRWAEQADRVCKVAAVYKHLLDQLSRKDLEEIEQ